MLRALAAVDLVVVFEQDTPLELIKEVRPDVSSRVQTTPINWWSDRSRSRAGAVEMKLCPILDGYSTTTSQIVELSNRDAIETVRQPN